MSDEIVIKFDLDKEIEKSGELRDLFLDEYEKALDGGKSHTVSTVLAYAQVENELVSMGKRQRPEKKDEPTEKKAGAFAKAFYNWLTESAWDQEQKQVEKSHVNITINTPDSKSFKDSQNQIKKEVNRVYKKENEIDFEIQADIFKVEEDKKLVYGWASIIEENGKQLIDKQGDLIDEEELIKAAHEYMTEYREGHEMHEGEQVSKTVESMVFTKDVQKALGIDLGKVGWFIVQKVQDDEYWQRIKKGEIAAFSIGGTAVRVPHK